MRLELGEVPPVVPLKEATAGSVRVVVPCSMLLQSPVSGLEVTLAVESAPPWALVTLTPEKVTVPRDSCPLADGVGEAQVLVAVTADAPAFTPMDVAIVATASPASGAATARNTTRVEAAFLGLLDAKVDKPMPAIEAGKSTDVMVTFLNKGNGPTRISLAKLEVPAGWNVTLPESAVAVVGPPGARMFLKIAAPASAPPEGVVGKITLRYSSTYEGTGSAKGDEGTIPILATAKGAAPPPADNGVPAAPWGLAAIAAAVVALARRR